jgi:electron transfer flavoprotein beta subunit
VEVDPVTGVLKRDGVASKLNPMTCMRSKPASGCAKNSAEACAPDNGPAQAREVILETVYMGADSGFLLSDRRFAGSDVLATAYALSQAAQSIGNFDLLLCGKQTTDGDTAQVGAEMAEFLNIAHAGNVLSVLEADKSSVTVKVNLESHIATQKITLPCLLCMDGDDQHAAPSFLQTKKSMQSRSGNRYRFGPAGRSGEKSVTELPVPPAGGTDFPARKKAMSRKRFAVTSKEMAGRLVQILHSRKFF